jgi:glycine/D-amino acid oxidase-like deaminating enzyme
VDALDGISPSVPHSLPVIGASPLVSNAYVACGHGHLGMTLGAVTATLVTDAILGREPKLDPRPFAPRARRAYQPRKRLPETPQDSLSLSR